MERSLLIKKNKKKGEKKRLTDDNVIFTRLIKMNFILIQMGGKVRGRMIVCGQ